MEHKGIISAQIWMKGKDIKMPPLFYLTCLRLFGAPSGRSYPLDRLCDWFMKHSCDYIGYSLCRRSVMGALLAISFWSCLGYVLILLYLLGLCSYLALSHLLLAAL